jgi:hypothetical protein
MNELRSAFMYGYRARSQRGLNWESVVTSGKVRESAENREAFMAGYRARNQRGLNWETYSAKVKVA